ncbi:hypothetical protein EDC01DRAFT_626808 [Geopyxis carbonaria]|nr:hypothetical protein EDC01DRAFT_626808 [Geopyxis carbonaria]
MQLSSLLLLLPAVSAHFTLNYPPSRGDDDKTQATGPCGGLDTPSSERTKWPLTGGQLSFKAGHEEAKTAVYLALSDKPGTADFSITLVQPFMQVGMGNFCWDPLSMAKNDSIKAGDKATIQVVQQGHTGGGLYNCADIVFTDEDVSVKSCANASTVSAEPLSSSSDHSAGHSSSAAASSGAASTAAASGTAAAASATATGAASAVRAASGLVLAGVVGAGAWLL